LFGSRSGTGSSFSLVSYLTIRLGVGDFSGDRLGTSSASRESLRPPARRPRIFLLFFSWFSYLNDDRTAVKLSLVQSLDSLLGGLDGVESNETVASGASSMTGPALNNLSADAVNWKGEMNLSKKGRGKCC